MTAVMNKNYLKDYRGYWELSPSLYIIKKKGKGFGKMNKKILGGVFFLAAGVLLLVSQLGFLPGEFFLLLLGGGFCMAYFLVGGVKEYSSVGFLVPGAILLAVGAYALLESHLPAVADNGAIFFATLSAGFWLVSIHTIRFTGKDHGGRFWPMYPASALLILSVIIYSAKHTSVDISAELFNYIWVFVLIIIGIKLVLTGMGKNSETTD